MRKKYRWRGVLALLLTLILCMPMSVSASEAGSGETDSSMSENAQNTVEECKISFSYTDEVGEGYVMLSVDGTMGAGYLQEFQEGLSECGGIWNDTSIVRYHFWAADSAKEAVELGASAGMGYISVAKWQEAWQKAQDFNNKYPVEQDGGQAALNEAAAIIKEIMSTMQYVTSEDVGELPELFGASFSIDASAAVGSQSTFTLSGMITEEYLQQLTAAGNSGHACVSVDSTEANRISFSFWVANAPGDVYTASDGSAVISQFYITPAELEYFQTCAETYNQTYPSSQDGGQAAFDAALEIVQEFAAAAKDVPDWDPAGAVTIDSGSIIDESTGEIINVRLQVAEITLEQETVLKPQVETILENSSEGYVLTGIQDVSIIAVDSGNTVNLTGEVRIAIPYPSGYGAGDEFAVYHWDGIKWEPVKIAEKNTDGIICIVDSLSPFAVAAKKADSTDTSTGDSGNTSSGNNTSSSGGSGSLGTSGNESSVESVALSDIPQTGDTFPIVLLSILGTVSAAVWMITYEKRKKEC